MSTVDVPPTAGARTRVALATTTAGILAIQVILYAALRVTQWKLYTEPDPAMVIWSTRIAMFWRLGVCAYAGLMLLPLGLRWARRDLDAAARAVAWLIPASAVVIALQASLVP